MKVIYEKTYYEQLIDHLEEAFLSGRTIKHIEVPLREYNDIMEKWTNPTFITSLKRKIWIKDVNTILESDQPLRAHISYHVVKNFHDQSAKLCFCQLVIL